MFLKINCVIISPITGNGGSCHIPLGGIGSGDWVRYQEQPLPVMCTRKGLERKFRPSQVVSHCRYRISRSSDVGTRMPRRSSHTTSCPSGCSTELCWRDTLTVSAWIPLSS